MSQFFPEKFWSTTTGAGLWKDKWMDAPASESRMNVRSLSDDLEGWDSMALAAQRVK